MTGRRAIVGLSLLCALAFCAFAAANASAAGTTAFTCVKAEAGGEFEDAHCTQAGGKGGFKHQEIAAGQVTSFVITNQNTKNNTTEATPVTIKFLMGGMDAEFQCPTAFGEGTLTNNAGPPMNVTGSVTVTLSGCVLVAPPGTYPECQLENSTIVTKKATLSTPAEKMQVDFGSEGGTFLTFRFVKCKNAAFNGEYQMKGSYSAIPNGTTWETTVESTKGLSITSQQASLVTKTTVTMSEGEPGISLTTG